MKNEYVDRAAIRESCCAKCEMHGEDGECFNPDPCEELLTAFLTAPAVEKVPCKCCKETDSSRS